MLTLISSCLVSFIAVSQKILQVKALLDLLVIKSDDLTHKIDEVSKVISDFKCALKSLEKDIEAVESIRFLVATQGRENKLLEKQNEHERKNQLEIVDDIQSMLEMKKETVEAVCEFSHPCGGSGWTRVAYYDFRREGTLCPAGFTTGEDGKPHVCVPNIEPTLCLTRLSFSSPKPYSSVCGRIAAYQVGMASLFLPDGGITLTHGNSPMVHIWSFAVGLTQSSGVIPSVRCPCDGGVASPPSVGEDYFCESGNTGNGGPLGIVAGNILWDGLGCISNSDCCSRIDHPYFVKHLETVTSDNIDMTICSKAAQNVALELVEIYVK